MSDQKQDGTALMMALLAGQSGEHASRGWERNKLENDIAWLGSELTKLKAEVDRLTGNLKAEQDAGWDMVAENTLLKAEIDRLTKESAYYQMSYKRVVADNRRLSERIDELEASRP